MREEKVMGSVIHEEEMTAVTERMKRRGHKADRQVF